MHTDTQILIINSDFLHLLPLFMENLVVASASCTNARVWLVGDLCRRFAGMKFWLKPWKRRWAKFQVCELGI